MFADYYFSYFWLETPVPWLVAFNWTYMVVEVSVDLLPGLFSFSSHHWWVDSHFSLFAPPIIGYKLHRVPRSP